MLPRGALSRSPHCNACALSQFVATAVDYGVLVCCFALIYCVVLVLGLHFSVTRVTDYVTKLKLRRNRNVRVLH